MLFKPAENCAEASKGKGEEKYTIFEALQNDFNILLNEGRMIRKFHFHRARSELTISCTVLISAINKNVLLMDYIPKVTRSLLFIKRLKTEDEKKEYCNQNKCKYIVKSFTLLPLPLLRTRLPPLNIRIAEVLARNHTVNPKGNEDNEERDKNPHDDFQNYV